MTFLVRGIGLRSDNMLLLKSGIIYIAIGLLMR